jgi:hypothetical protein
MIMSTLLEQAKEAYCEALNNATEHDMKLCSKAIETAAKNGKASTDVQGLNYPKRTANWLRNQGFIVELGSTILGESWFTISGWATP